MSRIIAFASIATTAAFSPSSAYKPIVTSRRTGPTMMPDYDSWAARVNLDIPSFGTKPEATAVMTKEEKPAVAIDDATAKAAWIAKIEADRRELRETTAKKVWLTKIDEDRKSFKGKIVPTAAVEVKEPVVTVSKEEAAKAKWLASIEK